MRMLPLFLCMYMSNAWIAILYLWSCNMLPSLMLVSSPFLRPCSYTDFLCSRRNLLSSSNCYNSKAITNSSFSNISSSNLLSLASNLKAQTSFFNKKSQELEACLLTGACQTLLGELNKYVSVACLMPFILFCICSKVTYSNSWYVPVMHLSWHTNNTIHWKNYDKAISCCFLFEIGSFYD